MWNVEQHLDPSNRAQTKQTMVAAAEVRRKSQAKRVSASLALALAGRCYLGLRKFAAELNTVSRHTKLRNTQRELSQWWSTDWIPNTFSFFVCTHICMCFTECPAGLALNSRRPICLWLLSTGMYSKACGAIPVLKNFISIFLFCIYLFTFSILFSVCMFSHFKCLTCVLLEKALYSPRLINNILPVDSFHQPHISTLLILSFYSFPHSPVNTPIFLAQEKRRKKKQTINYILGNWVSCLQTL